MLTNSSRSLHVSTMILSGTLVLERRAFKPTPASAGMEKSGQLLSLRRLLKLDDLNRSIECLSFIVLAMSLLPNSGPVADLCFSPSDLISSSVYIMLDILALGATGELNSVALDGAPFVVTEEDRLFVVL